MASVSRSTSRLGEERIPLSFKVVMEPELGSSRPAGTTGEDFRANRMVPPPFISGPGLPREQRACPCGARDEVRTIGAPDIHCSKLPCVCACAFCRAAPASLCTERASSTRAAGMRARAYTDAPHAAADASSAMMCRCRPSRWRLSSLPT